jgi:uncharacterized protein YndB with AHSA1/START domain
VTGTEKESGQGGERPIGLTQDSGWQVGARKTINTPMEEVWELVFSERGMRIWLGDVEGGLDREANHFRLKDGTEGEVRVSKPHSHIRLTWKPSDWAEASTIQVRIIRKGERSTIAFHQENMPSAAARRERRAFLRTALEQLEAELS